MGYLEINGRVPQVCRVLLNSLSFVSPSYILDSYYFSKADATIMFLFLSRGDISTWNSSAINTSKNSTLL